VPDIKYYVKKYTVKKCAFIVIFLKEIYNQNNIIYNQNNIDTNLNKIYNSIKHDINVGRINYKKLQKINKRRRK
jgi:hypothetical protein